MRVHPRDLSVISLYNIIAKYHCKIRNSMSLCYHLKNKSDYVANRMTLNILQHSSIGKRLRSIIEVAEQTIWIFLK